jgi:hypothetical protein
VTLFFCQALDLERQGTFCIVGFFFVSFADIVGPFLPFFWGQALELERQALVARRKARAEVEAFNRKQQSVKRNDLFKMPVIANINKRLKMTFFESLNLFIKKKT